MHCATRALGGLLLAAAFALGCADGGATPRSKVEVVLKDVDADGQFALTLDTSEKGSEQLRPKDPTATFTLKESDDVFVFEQKFTLDRPKAPPPSVRAAGGPVKLKPHGS